MSKKADAVEMARWAQSFTGALQKIKEGAETPNSAITLTHQECKDLVFGLQSMRARRDSD